MWKPEHRAAADRRGLRHPSDLTDAEWALVAPLIPPAERGGRPRTVDVREVLNGIFYVLWTGCHQWKALPKDLPCAAPSGGTWTCGAGTARSRASTTCSMSRCARERAARPARRPPSSTARPPGALPKGASLDPSGYDAAKKVTGRKRHILTDTLGLLLAVSVHPAGVQDRDGAEPLLRQARRGFPFLEPIIADAGHQGHKMEMEEVVARTGRWVLRIVRRCDRHHFVVLPKRRIVERTLARISRCRRLARDYERHARQAVAFVRLAMIRLMLRRLTTNL